MNYTAEQIKEKTENFKKELKLHELEYQELIRQKILADDAIQKTTEQMEELFGTTDINDLEKISQDLLKKIEG